MRKGRRAFSTNLLAKVYSQHAVLSERRVLRCYGQREANCVSVRLSVRHIMVCVRTAKYTKNVHRLIAASFYSESL